MKKFVVITDATCDLPQSLVAKYNLDYIPMEVNFGEEVLKQYLDEREFKLADFYARLDKKELAKTSLINMQTFVEKFTPYLEKGIDVMYIGISGNLSASFVQAKLAKEELEHAFKGRTVRLVDSKSASIAEGALVLEALKKQEEGKSLEEVALHVEMMVQKTIAFLVPINLDTLHRGGRVSGMKAFMGNLLRIKPILTLDPDGKLSPAGKAKGFKQALHTVIDLSKEKIVSPHTGPVHIVHANNEADAKLLADLFKETFGNSDVTIGSLGPVISAHTGTGAVCLVFFGTKR